MKKTLLLTLCGLIITATVSIAQPPPPPPEPRARMHEKVKTIKMWKLTEELDLTEAETAKFFPLFNKFEKKIQSLHEKNDELVKKLQGYILASETGKKTANIIQQIEQNEMEILKARTDFRKDAAKILDDTKLAKLVMFQHTFHHRLRDAIWERHKMRPGERKGEMQRQKRDKGPGAPMGMKGEGDNQRHKFGAKHKNHNCTLQQAQPISPGEKTCAT